MHAQAQQGPIVLDGGLHVHGVTAAMKGELVFPALFDPLDRPSEADGEGRDRDLFRK